MIRAQAAELLDEIDITDPEKAHMQADEILCRVAGTQVTEAYEALKDRCAWWAWS